MSASSPAVSLGRAALIASRTARAAGCARSSRSMALAISWAWFSISWNDPRSSMSFSASLSVFWENSEPDRSAIFCALSSASMISSQPSQSLSFFCLAD